MSTGVVDIATTPRLVLLGMGWPPHHPIEMVHAAGIVRSLCTMTPVSGGCGGILTPCFLPSDAHLPYPVVTPHLANVLPFPCGWFCKVLSLTLLLGLPA